MGSNSERAYFAIEENFTKLKRYSTEWKSFAIGIGIGLVPAFLLTVAFVTFGGLKSSGCKDAHSYKTLTNETVDADAEIMPTDDRTSNAIIEPIPSNLPKIFKLCEEHQNNTMIQSMADEKYLTVIKKSNEEWHVVTWDLIENSDEAIQLWNFKCELFTSVGSTLAPSGQNASAFKTLDDNVETFRVGVWDHHGGKNQLFMAQQIHPGVFQIYNWKMIVFRFCVTNMGRTDKTSFVTEMKKCEESDTRQLWKIYI